MTTDGQIIPADLAYTQAKAAQSELDAAEKLRAKKAGEDIAETDLRTSLRLEGEPDEHIVSWRDSQVLRPNGKVWGTLTWKGVFRLLLSSFSLLLSTIL